MKLTLAFLATLVLTPIKEAFTSSSIISSSTYDDLKFEGSKPGKKVYNLTLKGYNRLLSDSTIERPDIITIVDFTKPSTQKRLWVIDLEKNAVVFESLVAHGKNTGQNWAENFSNKNGSYKSSLGFYTTGETYMGKHGYSLTLDGREMGINNNARERKIVIHGAKYVSTDFITKHGRLGRSFGCPALPISKSKAIIDYIKNGSCLFIYYNDSAYLNQSKLLNL